MMKVSVVMATYNGERYLVEQLNSLKEQTRKPDEVIIYDDCSTDSTIRLIHNYIKNNNLGKTWQLIQNKKNIGWKQNFYNGIKNASGDIVFPCDQDDIWDLNKIKLMSELIENNSKISVLECKVEKFYEEENNKKISSTIYQFLDKIDDIMYLRKLDGRCRKYIFDKKFFRRTPGCALAIKKSFFKKNSFDEMGEYSHDSLISYFAKISGGYYILNDSLVKWRRYETSSSKANTHNKTNRIIEIERDSNMIMQCLRYGRKNNCSSKTEKILNRYAEWNECRKEIVLKKNSKAILKTVKFLDLYVRKRRFLTDIIYTFKRNRG